MSEMTPEDRQLRADAERNRRRLLDAAGELFSERGLEVGVGEIAERAGVGRGTLFRNFPSKEDLIAAVVAQRMLAQAERGRRRLETEEPETAFFGFLEEAVGVQQFNRHLFEAVADEFLANDQIRAAYDEFVEVMAQLIRRAQDAGAIRPDVGAVDVLMLIKGVCQAAIAFQHIDPEIPKRQLDLVRGALSVAAGSTPLRGRAPTVEDVERAHSGTAAVPTPEATATTAGTAAAPEAPATMAVPVPGRAAG
jgi:AcrR family transcriptional regulator